MPIPKAFSRVGSSFDPISLLCKGSKIAYFSCKFAYHTELKKTFWVVHYLNPKGKTSIEIFAYDGRNNEVITSKFAKLLPARTPIDLRSASLDYSSSTGTLFIHGYDSLSCRAILYSIDRSGVISDLLLDDFSSQSLGATTDIRSATDNTRGTVVVVGSTKFGDQKLILARGKNGQWKDLSPNTKFGLWYVEWFPDASSFFATGHGGSFAKISNDGESAVDRGVNLVLFSATGLRYLDKLGCCIFAQNGAASGDNGSTNLINRLDQTFDISPASSPNFETLVFYDSRNRFVLDVQCAYPPYSPSVLTQYNILDVSAPLNSLRAEWNNVTDAICSVEGYPRESFPVAVTVPAHCIASDGYIIFTLQSKKTLSQDPSDPWFGKEASFLVTAIDFEI